MKRIPSVVNFHCGAAMSPTTLLWPIIPSSVAERIRDTVWLDGYPFTGSRYRTIPRPDNEGRRVTYATYRPPVSLFPGLLSTPYIMFRSPTG